MCKQETVRYFVRQKEVVKRGWVRLLYSWYDAVFYSRWGLQVVSTLFGPGLDYILLPVWCILLYFVRSYSSEVSVTWNVCLQTLEQCRRICRCQKILITHDCMENAKKMPTQWDLQATKAHFDSGVQRNVIKMDHHSLGEQRIQ